MIDKGTGSNPVSQHPVETTGLVGAVVFMVCWIFGIDDVGVVCALGVIFGSVPTMITWIINTIRDRRDEVAIVVPKKIAELVAPADSV